MSFVDHDGYGATLYLESDSSSPFATLEGSVHPVIRPHITMVTQQVTHMTPADARNLAMHLIEAANATELPLTPEQRQEYDRASGQG
ncbi:hypothetical protein [Deinococcus alpinitundrae]|uniref:hypothetical protein n=1 Tax=Deinococcus alpinitundrae TaxID=468913 RepID=UPI0013799663|nr:hypothetical protein [Deinococcus alpinitundrae]